MAESEPQKLTLDFERVNALEEKLTEVCEDGGYSLPELVQAVGHIAYHAGKEDGYDDAGNAFIRRIKGGEDA